MKTLKARNWCQRRYDMVGWSVLRRYVVVGPDHFILVIKPKSKFCSRFSNIIFLVAKFPCLWQKSRYIKFELSQFRGDIWNEERKLGKSDNHRADGGQVEQRKTTHSIRQLEYIDSGTGFRRNKKKTLLSRVTKDRNLWRAIIAYVLRGKST